MIQSKIKKVSNFLFLFLICLTTPAFAAPSFWTPPAEDASINFLLNRFFGKALPDIGLNIPTGQDPFANMFAFFNAAILTVGCVFIAYTLIVGTMQTAHEGEMLGKQWSSMWIPIRTAMGVGLVVPLSSGYCTAQLLVMWLAVQGVGLADELWKAFANGTLGDSGLLLSTPNPQSVDLATEALKISICLEGLRQNKDNSITQWNMGSQDGQFPRVILNKAALISNPLATYVQKYTGYGYTNSGNSGASILSETEMSTSGDTTRSSQTYEGDEGPAANSACGFSRREIFRKDFNSAAAAGTSLGIAGSTAGAFFGPIGSGIGFAGGALIGFIFTDPVVNIEKTDVTEAHDQAFTQMMTNLKITAKNLVEGKSPTAEDFDNAILTYNKMVQQELSKKFNKNFESDFTQNATKQGWLMAGSWFARIAALINSINKDANKLPEVHFNSTGPAMIGKVFSSEINSALLRSQNVLAQSSLTKTYVTGISTQAAKDVSEGQINDSSSVILTTLIKGFADFDVMNLKNDMRHPLVTIQEMGVSMLRWIVKGVVTLAGIGVLTAFGGGTVAALLGPLIGMVTFVGFAAAVTMAIYVPLMPFVLFLGAALSWVIMVFEAMLAAPLWAIMHLAPGGNDIMGNARQGYQLLLALLLRPALLILGLASAIIIIYPFGILLNTLFFETFLLSQGEAGQGLYSFFLLIGASAIYAGILLKFLHKAFDLIHIVPDQLLKWIGGATSSDMGSTAGKLNEGGNTAIVALGQSSQQSAQTASRMPMDVKQANDAAKAAKAQQHATQDQLATSADNLKGSALEAGQSATTSASKAAQAQAQAEQDPSDSNKIAQMGRNAEAASEYGKSQAANQKIANNNSNPNISKNEKADAARAAMEDKEQAERFQGKNEKLFNEFAEKAKEATNQARENPGNQGLQEKARIANTNAANAAQIIKNPEKQAEFEQLAEQFNGNAESGNDKAVSTSPSPDSPPPPGGGGGGGGGGDGGGGPPPNDPPTQGPPRDGGGPRDSGNASSQTQSKPKGAGDVESTDTKP